ncbi:hypothetical protein AB434_3354 [Heyndrickxia coagulans]|uniref:Uncharacterized protein n=1 Tax=Heyndrickxia coagulans TaxID=1398 RepID=A0AAN0T4G7_HEYCO|nr:hypothetical protein SB48_HM08orf03051 [Heyndrickxia coagulans]AKN55759.1 hypothetical protein AB434_3354 [Heyndrickxia coagulans]KYC64026.1 hypothetical protein B4100_3160 [Heyndrickxia coagulans]
MLFYSRMWRPTEAENHPAMEKSTGSVQKSGESPDHTIHTA